MNGSLEEPAAASDEAGPGGDGHPPGVELIDPDGRVSRAGREWLAEKVGAALKVLDVAPADPVGGTPGPSLSVRLVGDVEMSAAHERYKGLAGTTDVLTFDLSDGEGLDADLLVCVDEARRQARARGHEEERELLLYVIHGVLHCLGHDDGDEVAAARMHAEEDRVLTAIGVGVTFAREASP